MTTCKTSGIVNLQPDNRTLKRDPDASSSQLTLSVDQLDSTPVTDESSDTESETGKFQNIIIAF